MKFMVFARMVCVPGLTLELVNYEETLKTTQRSKIESCSVFSFLKLFKLGPQASIFQHPLDLSLKLALRVVSENTNRVLKIQRAGMLNKFH